MSKLRTPLSKIDNYPAYLNDCWQLHLRERDINAPTVISTFAGCGGSSLGYSMAGFRELLAIEWDKNAVETFKLNFTNVPVIQDDIAKISVEQIFEITKLNKYELDVLDGSPPCQGFSTSGKRIMDDPRNQLFREYVRLLRGLQPKVFVMENVSGMVKGKMKLIFADILRELKASGYKVSARLLNAMYFNVPQSRQRLIFIGVREDLGIEPSHPKAESRPIASRECVIGDGTPLPEKYIDTWKHTKPGETFYEGRARLGIKPHSFDAQVLNPNKPAPTIKKQIRLGQSGLHHWEKPELLNSQTIQRLTSFPDEFQFIGNEKEKWARIGNSVPPLFMRSIARHIRSEILGS